MERLGHEEISRFRKGEHAIHQMPGIYILKLHFTYHFVSSLTLIVYVEATIYITLLKLQFISGYTYL